MAREMRQLPGVERSRADAGSLDMRSAGRGRPGARACAPAVAAVAALLLGLSAQGAQAGVREFQHGASYGNPTVADIRSMGDVRVKTLRLLLDWRKAEAARGVGRSCTATYDWTVYDQLMRTARSEGIEVLPWFAGSPRYASSTPNSPPPTSSPAIRDYACFVRAAVARYGRGGPQAGGRPITEWQAWNEPNIHVWSARDRVNPREYGRFLKVTSRAIRSEDRRATVVLAGMPEQAGHGPTIHSFLRRLYRVNGVRRSFDVLALHPYAANHRGVEGALIRLRRTLRRLGDRRRVLWITEAGFASSGPKGHFTVSSPRGQAKRLRKTFSLLRRERRRFNIGSVHWFQWRDRARAADKSHEWQDYTGLYKRGGGPKPSCRSYVRFTGGTCSRIGAGGGGGVVPLLLRSSGGGAGILPSRPE